jgi:hypothetical protein
MRSVRATRYVTAFREGGSLPGLVEADDDGLYVVKFRGAGQGPRVLVAEWLAGEIGRALGLLVPDLVAVELDAAIADSEPHEEIHDLLIASVGRNIGLDFLPGSLTFNPVVDRVTDPDWAASVVWLDGLVTNPDRSPRNPNLLTWHGRTWLIDHGAALYPQHSDAGLAASAHDRFRLVAQHVLLPFAGPIADADARLAADAADAVGAAIEAVPGEWLGRPGSGARGEPNGRGEAAARVELARFFAERLGDRDPWLQEAERARP